eukprot:scaffold12118_cov138-Cylindrotheca_fusiformis.AAC.11
MGMSQSTLSNKATSSKQQQEENFSLKEKSGLNQSNLLVNKDSSVMEEEDDDCDDDSESDDDDDDDEEWNERLLILKDARNLATLADFFLNPHKPIVTSDPFAYGRNYFTRPSATEETDEMNEEREMMLQDMKQLKQLAVDYLHPELPVVTSDPNACGRNYFTRASAEETEEEEMNEERELVLEDMKQLKQLAVDYLHPELPVVTSDPNACGRNYFTRASAEETEEEEMNEEQELILQDMKQLKQLAVDYLHPELPVVTSDPNACGRNYFTRASAEETEEEEMNEERELVLEDMKQLKQLAVDYLHPELPVLTTDPFACGRNYFTRASAEGTEEQEMNEEQELILQDMKQLKKLAVDYLHPELPVVTSDPYACGRNYFARASAEETEEVEMNEEQELILQDMKQLKKLAVDYLHPELPVVTTDPYACGRNYFARPSAEETEEEEMDEERELILQDMKQLKQLAVDYLHPELPVVATDPFACARNYFTRPSAEETEEEKNEEREMILEDMAQLKQLAEDYLYPEKKVVTTDAFAFGRNYFSRPSAPEQETLEESEERERIQNDAREMKKLAVDYLEPERPIECSAWGARNYFDRPSATSGHEANITSSGHAIFHTHRIRHHHQNHPVADKTSNPKGSDPSCVLSFGLGDHA